MKALFLILIGCFATAQNLVPNPSFETYSTCPTDLTQISNVSQWNRPPNTTGTPDYFNNCNQTIYFVGVPNNNYGTQQPFEGNGYVGLGTYIASSPSSDPNYREYIQTQLTSPLVAGQMYQLSFYVSLGDRCQRASNNIGAIFTIDQLTGNGTNQPINRTPQILNQNIISDSSGWTQISGTFIASGNERYLTIGNFFDDAHTQIQIIQTDFSLLGTLYYLDNVSVTTFLGVEDFIQNEITIYPNPSTNILYINNKSNALLENIIISDISGKRIKAKINNDNNNIDITELSKGIYFISFTADGNAYSFKFIKS